MRPEVGLRSSEATPARRLQLSSDGRGALAFQASSSCEIGCRCVGVARANLTAESPLFEVASKDTASSLWTMWLDRMQAAQDDARTA